MATLANGRRGRSLENGMGLDALLGSTGMTTLAEALVLVSIWKPLLFLPPFIAWAWVVSTICDKHAAKYYLERETWNFVHVGAAGAALAAAVLMPPIGAGGSLTWLVSLLVFCLLLAASVAAYVVIANRDERVPASGRVSFELAKLPSSGGAKAKKGKAKAGAPVYTLRRADKSAFDVPEAETPEYELRLALEGMITRAFETRASRMEIIPAGKDAYQSVFGVDGIKTPAETMPAAAGVKLIDYWKSAAKLDVNDRRRKQTADLTVERGTTKNKLRLETLGGQSGQRLVVLIDPEQQVRKGADTIGFTEPQLEVVRSWTQSKGGLVLLAGLPEGGRTTTMYTIVKMHDAYTNNVQTVEVEIADAMEGVRQNQWDAQAEGPDFATLVRSILRRDPDIVAVAQVPDQATAKELLKADADKCRVYASITADSAVSAIATWVKLVGDADAAAKLLQGVLAAKLVRKLCSNCKQTYQPAPDILKKLGLSPDKVKQLSKKGGEVLIKNKPETCPVCQGVGYLQREAAFEIFQVDDAARDMIRQQNWAGLKAELRKTGLPSLQQAALKKAIDGVTSVDEVLRVTSEGQPAAKPAATPAAAAGTPATAKPKA